MRRRVRIGLVFAYLDERENEFHCPEGYELNEQTKGRCGRAVLLYKIGFIRKIVATTALTVHECGKETFLADVMREYIHTQGIPHGDIIVHRHGFNTAGEIEGLCRLVSEEDAFAQLIGVRCSRDRLSILMFAVSSWYHLLRIGFLFLCHKRVVLPVPSFKGVTKQNVWDELDRMKWAIRNRRNSARTVHRPTFP